MLPQIVVFLSCQGFNARKLHHPVCPDLLSTDGVAPQDIADALMCHFSDIPIKEAKLDNPLCKECPDLGLGDGGDVVKPLRQVFSLRHLDHAPVSHERHPMTAEAL